MFGLAGEKKILSERNAQKRASIASATAMDTSDERFDSWNFVPRRDCNKIKTQRRRFIAMQKNKKLQQLKLNHDYEKKMDHAYQDKSNGVLEIQGTSPRLQSLPPPPRKHASVHSELVSAHESLQKSKTSISNNSKLSSMQQPAPLLLHMDIANLQPPQRVKPDWEPMIVRFPHGIWNLILRFLPSRHLYSCSLVCSEWNKIVMNVLFWKERLMQRMSMFYCACC